MRKANYFYHILMIIILPFAIILLSSNLVLRVSETYDFHYNESEVINSLYTDVKPSEFSKEITKYLKPFSKSEFQVYEKNGQYRDPFFDKNDQKAMEKAKILLTISLTLGLAFALIFGLIYWNLYSKGYREAVRIGTFIGCGLTVLSLIVYNIVFSISSFRGYLYRGLISIPLDKKSVLDRIFTGEFYRVYLNFTTITSLVFIGIILYVTISLTRKNKIFS